MSQARSTLLPINLHDPIEFLELQRQRTICGWFYSDLELIKWRDLQDQKLKSLFWITLPASSGDPDPQGACLRVGHISLDAYADPPDLEVANPDKSILTVQTFFILPEYRADGFGRLAMDLTERLATQEPYGSEKCRWLTVNTVSKRYVFDESPEWQGCWAKMGLAIPKWSNEVWYERRGYVKWKEEPRYKLTTLDGQRIVLVAVFLRKPTQ